MTFTKHDIIEMFQVGIINRDEARQMLGIKYKTETITLANAITSFSAQLPKMNWENAINKTEAMKIFKE